MLPLLRCLLFTLLTTPLWGAFPETAPLRPPETPYGDDFAQLDLAANGAWWQRAPQTGNSAWQNQHILERNRAEAVAFALYTQDTGVLKLTAQLAPLLPSEPRQVTLEFADAAGQWQPAATSPVLFPGWSAHFRIEDWDATRAVAYRVRLGDVSSFEGLIRADPADKSRISVAVLSCNSNQDRGDRDSIVNQLRAQDPDLLFFAGDQSYDHQHHTAAWLAFGRQFREILRDRPTITIPDDHDIGQGNLWGAGGVKAPHPHGNDGGYYYPADYVRMVERCQTWHLPDAFDPRPVAQNIGVYFTRLRVGGVDFAILEDRKFKTGPNGTIPPMGPRPDHINDPAYDRAAVDLPGLKLLGDRQLAFLDHWTQDWSGAEMKAALSQTAFAGAVHIHGNEGRLLADLDSNAWPQSGRNAALRRLRQARAVHLAGDQHLAVAIQHGIENFRDGPYAFTTPAIVNNYYSRWWHPLDDAPGAHRDPHTFRPWTGDYLDGLGNKLTMLTYVNPGEADNGNGDGYGLVHFDKPTHRITFEYWPRFSAMGSPVTQTPDWPITFYMEENDGRTPTGTIVVPANPVVSSRVLQVVDESTQEILYTQRFPRGTTQLPVYGTGPYTIRSGTDHPATVIASGLNPTP